MRVLLGLFLAFGLLFAGDTKYMYQFIVVLGMLVVAFILLSIMFLLSQSKFAKTIECSGSIHIWIWTQIIPIWSLIATPIALIKLDAQYKRYTNEQNISNNPQLVQYKNIWGWVWFGGMILSIGVDFFAIVAIVGFIGYWVHISKVTKSLEAISSDEVKEY